MAEIVQRMSEMEGGQWGGGGTEGRRFCKIQPNTQNTQNATKYTKHNKIQPHQNTQNKTNATVSGQWALGRRGNR